MKVAAGLLGLVAVGGLIVMAVAGMTAALGVLVTAVAIVGMIALGNLLGGRTTPDRPPFSSEGDAEGRELE
jgi:drug/metabolite transporter (DMT)-like permease